MARLALSRCGVLLAALVAVLLLLEPVSAGYNKQAMLLQDATSLIFTGGEMTQSRRSSAIPQLSCKRGPCQYAPTSALCRNVGFDGSDVTWQCEAELPKGVRFGKVEVSCEGFSSRDDEYVLKGSCGLEYGLEGEPVFDSEEREEDSWWNRNVRGSAGKKTHPHLSHAPDRRSAASSSPSWLSGWLGGSDSGRLQQAKDYAHDRYEQATDSWSRAQHGVGALSLLSWLASTAFSLMFRALALCIVLFLLYRMCRPAPLTAVPSAAANARPGLLRSLFGLLPFGSMLGSAPAYGQQPPPPPYSGSSGPSSSPYDKTYPSSASYSGYTQPPPQQQQQGGGLGFLPGALGGSLLGYLMGRRRAGATQTQEAGWGSWLGGGSGARARPAQSTVHHVHHNAPPPFSPEYSSTRAAARHSSSGSGYADEVKTTDTSTAYARTKRR